jgi:hypothetical protein
MRRYMCQVVFLDEDEVDVASAKLAARGFKFMISDRPEDFDEGSAATRFGMVWKDFADDADPVKAGCEFENELDALRLYADEFGFVAPGHVPRWWCDFGEPPSLDEVFGRRMQS